MPVGKIKLFAAALFCGALVASLSAQAALALLSGHVPVAVAGLTANGRLAPTNQLSLALSLPLRNPAALNELLSQLYDPGSTNFHKFITPQEFAARFGPTEADCLTLQNFARTNGLAIVGTPGNRLVLDVTGPVAAIEKAFQVTLRTYRHPTEARNFFAPDTEPLVDSSLPLSHITGLDNFLIPRPANAKKTRVSDLPAGVSPASGSGLAGLYVAGDFRAAYVPGVALTGAGQSVALFELDGYFPNDIKTYESEASLPPVPLTNVLVDSYSGTAGANNTEVALDIDMAIGMATNLTQVIVYEGQNNNVTPVDILNRIAADDLAKQISSSWLIGDNSGFDTAYLEMSAQGQSFFQASGDNGAYYAGIAESADDTNITLVGGTTLSMNGNGASYASETVWNWYSTGQGKAASGGGISLNNLPIPSWQTGINMSANQCSTTIRNIPDVALTADSILVVADNGTNYSIGGTSAAAPLWAGFTALMNQQAAVLNVPPVGFINPAVYAIGKGPNYVANFHDITTGNNTNSTVANQYTAAPGYDLCTGWGTPNGQTFINTLVPPDSLLILPPNGTAFAGVMGGPFSPSSQNYVLTNSSASPFAWSLVITSAWLNASATSGILPAGAATNIIINSGTAGGVGLGAYTANIKFTNWGTHVVQTLPYTLQVTEPLSLSPAGGFTAGGPVGGPFNVTAQNYTLSNASAASFTWQAGNTSAWLNISPPGGTVGGYAQSRVTAGLNAAASNLMAGVYSATIFFTNQNSGTVQSRVFTLAVGQALVQNGGFETGDFTGWSLAGNGYPDNFVTNTFAYNIGSSRHPNIITISPHSGTYFATLGEPSVQAYLSQNLPTSAGQAYLISLWLDSPDGLTPNEFSLAWNGGTLFDQVNMPKLGWTNLQFIVTATGTSTTLQIGARNDPSLFGLDDVSVLPGFAPTISTQPTNLTLVSGATAVFSALVTGSTNLIYQWKKNDTNLVNGTGISGATTNLLTLTGVTTNNTANYTLAVTNIFGAVTSSVAVLSVVQSPGITSSSLTNRVLECGGNITYVINASGTAPLFIQWSYAGLPLPGATNSTLLLTNVHFPSSVIAVAVTNLYGSLASNATLTVNDTQPPVITMNGGSRLTNELGTPFFDPGATAIDACAGVVPVTTNGTVNVNVVGTNMLIYTATDGNGNTNTVVRTVIVQDTTPPTITWSFTNLVLAANSSCVALMTNVTGTNYILATDLSGALTITQSPTNNAVLPLGTNGVVITVADTSGNKSYSTNQVVVLDLTPPAITLIGGSPLTNELGASFADPGVVARDNCSGIVLLATNGSVNVNSVATYALTYVATDGSGNTNSTMRTVIVRDTTPPTITWSFTNLLLLLDTNCNAFMPDVTGTNYVLASDLSGPLVFSQSPTNASALPLGTNVVIIAVADAYGNTSYCTNQIVVQDALPLITVQPQSRTNTAGTTVVFAVAAGACTPLSFQWLDNNVPLALQTNSSLTLSNLTTGNTGSYSVAVTSSGGSVTSAVAVLTVSLLAPGVSLASSVNPDGFKGALNFTAAITPTNGAGTIQFLTNGVAFDLELLVAGSATSTNIAALPRGTNLITAIYSGSASYLRATNVLLQVVTNHPPAVMPVSFSLTAGLSLSIPVTNLAASWNDVDGDTLFIAAINPSTNGAVVTNATPALFYANTNYVNDQFVCVISDGFGGTNLQTVSIVIQPQTNSIPGIGGVGVGPSGLNLTLNGAYGSTYILQSTTNLFFGAWHPMATNTLGVTGVWHFTDTQVTNDPSQYYRLELIP